MDIPEIQSARSGKLHIACRRRGIDGPWRLFELAT
jgi:hypothetical protein